MPQQVNLCLPILRKQKERFSAQALALTLGLLLVAGAVLSAGWVWRLNRSSDSLNATLAVQAKELESLRMALERAKISTGPAQASMLQEVKQRKLLLQQREQMLGALGQGMFQPGQGHSARLQLVAQTIPTVAWVTHLKADEQLLDLSGFTLEPAVLNDWVNKLSVSPLLVGQSLSTVQVEHIKPDAALAKTAVLAQQPVTKPGIATSAAIAAKTTVTAPALWSFGMLSRMAVKPAGATSAPNGGKP
jgi:Tfp pilus assembly protein PilN